MKNLRLVNKYREDGGGWIDASTTTLAYAKKLLGEMREAEPADEWHLETRGTSADWHRIDETVTSSARCSMKEDS
jgi:hypothetical protein